MTFTTKSEEFQRSCSQQYSSAEASAIPSKPFGAPSLPRAGTLALRWHVAPTFWLSFLIGTAEFFSCGQPVQLPTANRALFEKGGDERFFAGTAGKPWTTGTFGCVRTEGWQMHEGLDIRCLQRDKHGEPTDPVMATADGTVAYI